MPKCVCKNYFSLKATEPSDAGNSFQPLLTQILFETIPCYSPFSQPVSLPATNVSLWKILAYIKFLCIFHFGIGI